MTERLKGACILLPLLIILVIGGPALYITATILTTIGLFELYSAFKKINIKPIYPIGLLINTYLILQLAFNLPPKFAIIIFFIFFICLSLLTISNKYNILDIATTLFGTTYITLPFSSIIYIYNNNNYNPNVVWVIFIIAFSTDTFAYFIGKKLGKHKLIPKISPNKTIEGSLGGILGSTIAITFYCIVFSLDLKILIPVAIIGSILSQIGDLFASSIKRYSNIKDFGDLIPGHGGIIDRLDSILFVAPTILCFMLLS